MLFKDGCQKAFTMSWDDGLEQDIPLIKLLDKYGVKATFNLNSGLVAPEGHVYDKNWPFKRMSYSGNTKTFLNSGHEVAMHGYEHPEMTQYNREVIAAQIVRDKLSLEKQFKEIIRGYACPWGTIDDRIEEALRICGVAYARTVEATYDFKVPENWLHMPVTCHQSDPRIMELAEKFVTSDFKDSSVFYPKLFYVWGHSYELDAGSRWDKFEDFIKFVSNRQDVWYATNIEIVDYVNAFRSIISSSDSSILYNPSATDLYLYAVNLDEILHGTEGKVYKLPAGGKIILAE